MKVNGDFVIKVGLTDPSPFSEIITDVAEPPKVFPDTVTGVNVHVFPDVSPRVSIASLSHPHVTSK